MPTRRQVLQTIGGTLGLGAAGVVGLGGYAVGIEPQLRLEVTRYDLALPRWPAAAKPLRIAILADIHAVDPWMTPAHIADIVARANALAPDLILLLGDYVGTMPMRRRIVGPHEWAEPLGGLKAPLGVYGILGNHDWWWSGGPAPVVAALKARGIPVLVNEARRIDRDGHRFWLSATDSMIAHGTYAGAHDLRRAFRDIADDLPVIHLAHEPDLFVEIPGRVALTLSGHTHGGQIRIPGVGPAVVPSAYGRRFAYGHVDEQGRHLLVSGGLGCSMLPARFLAPPEIVLATVHGADILPQRSQG